MAKADVIRAMHERVQPCQDPLTERVLVGESLGVGTVNHISGVRGHTILEEESSSQSLRRRKVGVTGERLFPGFTEDSAEQATLSASQSPAHLRAVIAARHPDKRQDSRRHQRRAGGRITTACTPHSLGPGRCSSHHGDPGWHWNSQPLLTKSSPDTGRSAGRNSAEPLRPVSRRSDDHRRLTLPPHEHENSEVTCLPSPPPPSLPPSLPPPAKSEHAPQLQAQPWIAYSCKLFWAAKLEVLK